MAAYLAGYAVNLVVAVALVPADRSSLPGSVERTVLLANAAALSAFTVALLALFVPVVTGPSCCSRTSSARLAACC
jgi:hypothetical protein